MIIQDVYDVEPWCVRESELDLADLAQGESVFALSNGHLGLRGNLDEGEPHVLPGTYLNSVHELRPLPYAEAGYGYPDAGQTVINITNGKIIRLLVDDEPFDVRYGVLRRHQRVLDLRAGTLHRDAEWTSPAGSTVALASTRLVSLTHRSVAAIDYQVTAVDRPIRLVVQSELVANETLPEITDDPRAAVALDSPLVACEQAASGASALLVHRVNRSGLLLAAGMDHRVHGPESAEVQLGVNPEVARFTVVVRLEPGQTLRLVKLLAYGWSARRSRPALHDQVVAALAGAAATGWDGLLAEQRHYLDTFWAGADVEVDGDPDVQQAVRFALFQLLQASARAERRPIAAKGLTGPGYDGHTFWDTDTFVLPVLDLTQPHAAADALRWRQDTLELARDRARQLGLAGAAFPWRTITGQECSAYWPAGTAAFHLGADIADAVLRHVACTGDVGFEAETGLELLVETARLWMSLGHFGAGGEFRIHGVTGPDEYSALVANNVYTNLMARRNLRGAADVAERHPERARRLGVDPAELTAWRAAADAMFVPYDQRLGVHPQHEGFTDQDRWDFAATKPEQYPLLLHVPYVQLYRRQVVKQADLVLALHLCGQEFTPEAKARDFAYYEGLTVRDSSLSAATQAVVAAEVGHLELAHAYLRETAQVDLDDLGNNTRDGLHLAALAGTWTGLVAGFGGLRVTEGPPAFAPRLPAGIHRLTFRLLFRGRRLAVTVTGQSARYQLLDGEQLELTHHGTPLTLADRPVELAVPPVLHRTQPPRQPAGRAPQGVPVEPPSGLVAPRPERGTGHG